VLPQTYLTDQNGSSRPLIRTFHGRQGRLSKTRLKVLQNVVPKDLIPNISDQIDLRHLFSTEQVIIDFGCGMGGHTADLLAQKKFVLAVDVHTAGICDLAILAQDTNSANLRLFHGDGVGLLTSGLVNESISELHVYFPDPWPKPRHAKRRLFNENFLALAHRILIPNGKIILVTDDDVYAAAANEVIKNTSQFSQIPYTETTSATSYFLRARKLNHSIHEFALLKI